jgi:hypothetical protein
VFAPPKKLWTTVEMQLTCTEGCDERSVGRSSYQFCPVDGVRKPLRRAVLMPPSFARAASRACNGKKNS